MNDNYKSETDTSCRFVFSFRSILSYIVLFAFANGATSLSLITTHKGNSSYHASIPKWYKLGLNIFYTTIVTISNFDVAHW